MSEMNRRNFLKFAGTTVLAASVAGTLGGCGGTSEEPAAPSNSSSSKPSGGASSGSTSSGSTSSSSTGTSSSSSTSQDTSTQKKVLWLVDSVGTGRVLITGFSSDGDRPSGVVQIPQEIAGKQVVGIGWQALAGCTEITEIVLPKTVIGFDDFAFSGCKKLRKINFTSSILLIGEFAFRETAITDVTIPKSVKEIDAGAFMDSKLQRVRFEGEPLLEGGIFSGCKYLKDIELPKKMVMTSRASSVYYDKSAIPGTFFKDCSSLVNIVIPESVTAIGDSAFEGCTSLQNVKMSANLTTIRRSAFAYCTSLKKIAIPNRVNFIGFKAFMGCTNLQKVYIPKTVTNVSEFGNCDSLTDIYYEGTRADWANVKIGGSVSLVTIHYGANPSDVQ